MVAPQHDPPEQDEPKYDDPRDSGNREQSVVFLLVQNHLPVHPQLLQLLLDHLTMLRDPEEHFHAAYVIQGGPDPWVAQGPSPKLNRLGSQLWVVTSIVSRQNDCASEDEGITCKGRSLLHTRMDGAVTGIDFLQAFRPNAGDQLVEVGVDIIKRDDCERVRLLCDVVRRRGIGSQADIRKLGAALNAAPFQCPFMKLSQHVAHVIVFM
mmetsp:Transcript_13697/g.24286  ORF Transcript_13697/g.24286 Transcript_13697/m.24286 type:complete len:209 (+) Transcript_13697:787-1413(+)